MVLTPSLSLFRILRYTWKVDLLIIATCTAMYYVHEHVIPRAIQLPPMLPTLLGTALAFFVGFNNNQAYDRWWEARIIWGALVNDSRSWARNVLEYTIPGNLNSEELELIKRKMILRQIGFVYALKESLRKKADGYYKQFFTHQELEQISKESNIPNAILSLNARDVEYLTKQNCISEFRFMQFNGFLTLFTDHMGKSERISNTVFPTSYIYFTKLFIWVLVIFITIILADNIGVWSILLGWIIGFVFHVSHQNGMALMEPFQEIPSGMPLNQISRVIEINLLQMMGEKKVPEPVAAVNGEYIL